MIDYYLTFFIELLIKKGVMEIHNKTNYNVPVRRLGTMSSQVLVCRKRRSQSDTSGPQELLDP